MAQVPSSQSDTWPAWYERHAGNLLLFARQWLTCGADAEDAVQAGFVKFWRNKPRPAPEDLPLLYATVRCAALDLIKGQARRTRREETARLDSPSLWWDANSLEQREQALQMQQALLHLTEDQREVVVLRVWSELTFAQIATALDAPLNTITSRYRYALSNLRKFLPADCHERIGA